MGGESGTRFTAFPAALRGYRPDQVDRYLDEAEAAVAAGGRPAEPDGFDIALRGYDRRRVDDHIAALLTRP